MDNNIFTLSMSPWYLQGQKVKWTVNKSCHDLCVKGFSGKFFQKLNVRLTEKIAQKCASMKTQNEKIWKNSTSRTRWFSVFDNKCSTVSFWILQHLWWLGPTTEPRVSFLEVNCRGKVKLLIVFYCSRRTRCQYIATSN